MATRPAVARADVVGSLLRPEYLRETRDATRAGRVGADEVRAAEDRAVLDAIALQESAGFGEADLENGGSERLQDAVIAWGDERAIRDRVQAHLDAGADHVCIQTLPSVELDLDALRRLAPALLGL